MVLLGTKLRNVDDEVFTVLLRSCRYLNLFFHLLDSTGRPDHCGKGRGGIPRLPQSRNVAAGPARVAHYQVNFAPHPAI